jgi:hypothetical protein
MGLLDLRHTFSSSGSVIPRSCPRQWLVVAFMGLLDLWHTFSSSGSVIRRLAHISSYVFGPVGPCLLSIDPLLLELNVNNHFTLPRQPALYHDHSDVSTMEHERWI